MPQARRALLLAIAVPIALLILASCGEEGDDGEQASPTGQPTPGVTETPGEAPGNLIADAGEPVAMAFTPDGRMFFTERQSGEVYVVQVWVPDELVSLPIVQEARREFAELATIDATDVEVVEVVQQTWPDSCLGLGDEGEACATVLTSGYEVTLRSPDVSGGAVFRTDETDEVRLDSLVAVVADSELFTTVDVFLGFECGLLGIAVDPDFETNRHVYIFVTQPVEGESLIAQPRVIRFTDVDGVGTDPTVMVGDLPTTNPEICAHVGGNLHFGPDGYLYLSVGNFEFTRQAVAADLSSPLGKILRMNKEDGSGAPDNPFVDDPEADPRVFAYGLRNPFDFAFHPETGKIYSPDNGPGNCDELNLIEAGADYGVPGSLRHGTIDSCLGLGGVEPIYLFALPDMEPTEFGSNTAPAGVAFLDGDLYPALGQGLLVCHFNTGRMELLKLGGPDFDEVEDVIDVAPCSPNVAVYDGRIYYIQGFQRIFELPPEAIAP